MDKTGSSAASETIKYILAVLVLCTNRFCSLPERQKYVNLRMVAAGCWRVTALRQDIHTYFTYSVHMYVRAGGGAGGGARYFSTDTDYEVLHMEINLIVETLFSRSIAHSK